MEPVVTVAALWLLFAGTHVGLGLRPVRDRLVTRFGEWGFIGIFSVVASISVTLLVGYYAVHRFDGPAGLALGATQALRTGLISVVVLGVVLITVALGDFARSPYARMDHHDPVTPRGFARITRHGFFVGVALLGFAHALLATRLIGTVFFGALAVFPLLGSQMQDRKLLARRGDAHARYLAVTSTLPFLAILSRRQTLVWSELSWGLILLGLGVAWGLHAVHASILSFGGAWVIVVLVGGAGIALIAQWRHARREMHLESV